MQRARGPHLPFKLPENKTPSQEASQTEGLRPSAQSPAAGRKDEAGLSREDRTDGGRPLVSEQILGAGEDKSHLTTRQLSGPPGAFHQCVPHPNKTDQKSQFSLQT